MVLNTPQSYSMIVFPITIQMAIRNSQQRCSVRKGVLRNFAKFTGKQQCNKVPGLSKFLRTPFLQNTSCRLLLTYTSHNNNIQLLFIVLL